jgi:chromosome segregation ATPase
MGREAAFTYEDVAAAADASKSAGIKPTSRGIREKLGNVGSMGTINKLLRRWKANQDYEVAPPVVLPAALQRAILGFMDQELSKARAALEAELVEHQQEAADLATENERQLETIESQTEQLAALGAENAAADGKAIQLAVDLGEARAEAARERSAAEGARTELAKAQLRLEVLPRLDGELVAIRDALESERRSRIQAEQAAAVLTAQKVDLEGRLLDWKDQVERVGVQLVKLQERAERLSVTLDSERQGRIDAEQKAAVLVAQKADLESRLSERKVPTSRIEAG